ncbi:MAG: hypothetical protein JSU67_13370 [Gammaproteobacteria bacterium]|nr:MAG: hypothetical protein JSU67_13370 [Gammaproteobacteria bacterium]
MTSMLIAIPLFMLAVIGLALGVILKRRPLGGSCGNCTNCLVRKVD